ncbi:hypothetical protein [Pseudophaeobacter sp.]|uniref:hypothetical protein n=1 Tax=Pseudophaeobacter sp. TaxID=1971739 RepID=UPI003299EB11
MFRTARKTCLSLLTALPIALAVALPANAQSISQHFSKATGSCYQREYSASHLAKHPTQKVATIQLSHAPQESLGMPGNELTLRLTVRLLGYNTWQTPVLCAPKGNALFCGIECDGGRFDVVVKNASSILITGGTDLFFSDCESKPRILERAPDDKVFMLHRAPLANCHP